MAARRGVCGIHARQLARVDASRRMTVGALRRSDSRRAPVAIAVIAATASSNSHQSIRASEQLRELPTHRYLQPQPRELPRCSPRGSELPTFSAARRPAASQDFSRLPAPPPPHRHRQRAQRQVTAESTACCAAAALALELTRPAAELSGAGVEQVERCACRVGLPTA